MKREIFAKRLVLPIVAGFVLSAVGCTTNRDVPVRNSKGRAGTTRTTPPPPPPPVVTTRPREHTVRQGETLYAVSRLYNIPVADLIAWNALSRPGQLDVGQTLRLVPPDAVIETVPLASRGDQPQSNTFTPPPVKRDPRGGKQPWSEQAWEPSAPREVPAAPVVPPPNTAPAVSDWIWPVVGTIIGKFDETSGGDAKVRNRGIDIAGTPGTPILAAADGKVVYAGSGMPSYGKLVIIKHSEEYLTAYAHNRVILVKENAEVRKGQKIAELGDTGTGVDRPKLHFELRRQGQPVDPLKYLPAL